MRERERESKRKNESLALNLSLELAPYPRVPQHRNSKKKRHPLSKSQTNPMVIQKKRIKTGVEATLHSIWTSRL